MAEHFSFFDAVLQDDGVTYDREYNAQEFTDYFKTLITTGVMKGSRNMLAVSANGSNMVTSLNTGIAFIEGRYYLNDAPLSLTHDTETLGNNRIDRIVIRMNLSTEARYVKAFVKKGTPSTNPVAPTLTQTPNLYEISLAQVKIVGGQTFIAANALTDERGKDVICPWAGSNILPSFDDNALAEHIKTKASITQEGHVRLNNTLTSTSTVEAATANTIKQLNDTKASIAQPAELSITLQNGWVGSARYYKDTMGLVHVYFVISGGTKTKGTVLADLPVGYRPSWGLVTFSGITYTYSDMSATAIALELTNVGRLTINHTAKDIIVAQFSYRTD